MADLDALESREAWEVIVDAVCDAIPEAAPPHVCEESPDELLVKGDPAHEEFAADAVIIEKLRAELHDEARDRFETLSRALEARGFAIVRVR
jgi:hypothetical protein